MSAMQLPRRVRDGIEIEEIAQLKAVVGHANYKANPFLALQQHLNSTLPPPEVPKRLHGKKKGKSKQQQRQPQRRSNSNNNSSRHGRDGGGGRGNRGRRGGKARH